MVIVNREFFRVLILFSLLFSLLFADTGLAVTEAEQALPTDTVEGSTTDSVNSVDTSASTASLGSESEMAGSAFPSLPIVTADSNTGAASAGISIVVPPGRKGIQPNLTLTYNSNKKNGWVGIGWDLSIGSIQRNTKHGVSYDANDFVQAGPGFSDLVPRGDWGTNYYGAKIEGGFSKYYYNPAGGWEVTAKDGTKYYFGTTSASRQYNQYGVFKWCLDKVQDINGNYMTFTYWTDQSEVYIDKIDYTGHATLSPMFSVKFYWESRPDSPVMYTTNSAVTTAYRLKTIEVMAGTSQVRAYKLTYDASSSISESVLASVEQYGTDYTLSGGMVTGGTALPQSSFSYASGSKNFTGSIWTNAGVNSSNLIGDFNGDGRSDFMQYVAGYGWRVLSSTGNGFTSSIWSSEGEHTNQRVGDFNGDGKSDFMQFVDGVGWRVHISTGSSFTSSIWSGSGSWDSNLVGDFNGDGKSDFLQYKTDEGWRVHLSTGSSFTSSIWSGSGSWDSNLVGDFNGDGKSDFMQFVEGVGWRVHISTGSSFTSSIWSGAGLWNKNTVGDFNGDGKSDFLQYKPGEGWRVHLSTGSSFTSSIWSSAGENSSNMVGDFNGDGKSDFMQFISGTGWRVLLSTGSSFTDSIWSSAGENSSNMVGDFNGDGKSDSMQFVSGTGWRVSTSNDAYSYLTSIENGFGGSTSIAYQPSSAYTNNRLPFIVSTVSSMTVNDGNGSISTTGYTYYGGLYEPAARELRGFSYSKATDPAGTTNETWFKQDDIFKGRPYDQLVKDSSGNLYSRTYNTWASTSPYTGVDFPYVSTRNDYIYDGTGTYKRSAVDFEYDTYGNLIRRYYHGETSISGDERDEHTEYNHDTVNWILHLPSHAYVNDSGGVKVSEAWFTYDSNGNLLSETKWLDGVNNPVVNYGYDAFGNLTSLTDARGYTATITYDSTYKVYPVNKTNPLGQIKTTYYNMKFGKASSEYDLNGNLTTYTYDVFGRVTKITGPNDTASTYGTVSYLYLDFGTPGSQRVVEYNTEQSGTSSAIWRIAYFDGLGRTYRTRREGPGTSVIVQDVEYDQRGLKISESLPYFEGAEMPRYITFAYDPVGRPTLVTNPDNTTVQTSYDKGRLTTIDANGRQKVHEKDVFGNLVKVEEYTGSNGSHALYATTTYQYDDIGRLLGTTDALGNQTSITYDNLGRKTAMTDPDMGAWSYAYDANGNLTSQTDAKGQTITFTYDALNRVTLKNYPTGTDVTYTYDETFSTNPKGRLTTLIDAAGTTKFYYDKMGGITKSVRTIGGVSYTIETAYDALGRTTSVKYPDNEIVSYTYDTAGNLSSAGSYASYSGYNALGQAGTITYGNGTTTSYQYSSTNNRLSSITTSKGATNYLNLSYVYDNNGNIASINDLVNSARNQGFSYDDLDRLTQAQSTSYGTLAYSYNQIGNMLSKEGVGYTYGGPRPHAVTATSDGKSYAYDGNGNMTSDGLRVISYNYDNLPSAVTRSGVTTSFVYDGNGLRVKKISAGVTTVYISKVYECANGACAKYIFAGDTRVALKKAVGTLYYHQDHLNSSSIVTDAAGNKVEEIYYYPYGSTRVDAGAVSVNHKYTSQELDSETGLYYYGARYYNPVLGRFISPDSMVPNPSNPQDLNRYAYASNNPLIYIDPTGHFSWKKFANSLISGVVGGAAFVLSGGNPVLAGMAAGAVYGALEGGDIQSALMGAAMGGIAGGFGAAIVSTLGPAVGGGLMLGGGGGLAYSQGGWDGLAYFAGGVLGGISGAMWASSITVPTRTAGTPIAEDPLDFDGKRLTATDANDNPIGSWGATSGRPGSTPSDQWKVGYGPLPGGKYSVNPENIQRWENLPWYQKAAAYLGRGEWKGGTVAWGHTRVPIEISSGTNIAPRTGGFFIHGGLTPGSAGCIDVGINEGSFFNYLSGQNEPVPLTVNYK